jgi:DNA-binding GntR family transcriptional regulator
MLVSLFAEPGMNRTTLIDRIIDYAGVSRSTAERAIHEARQSGYIVDRREGREVRHFLSDRLFNHCIEFFRNYMDLEKIIAKLGYNQK